MIIRSANAEETRAAGARLAANVRPGDVYGLVGGLGAGKTEFVRGFVAALAPGAEVRSPTFTLVNTYETPLCAIHHFDFYRLKSSEELFEIGFSEYIDSDAVCLIEWADMFPRVLPAATRSIHFREDENHARIIEMNA